MRGRWTKSLRLATWLLLATAGSVGAVSQPEATASAPQPGKQPELAAARQALEVLEQERGAFETLWQEQALTGAAADQAHTRALQGFEKRRAHLLVDLNLAQGNLLEAARWSEWLNGQENPPVLEPLNLDRVNGQLLPADASQPAEVTQ